MFFANFFNKKKILEKKKLDQGFERDQWSMAGLSSHIAA